MFKALLGKGNYVNDQILMTDVPEYLKAERTTYAGHIFDFILNYVNGTDLIINDLDLLLGKKIYWDNIQIYAVDAESTAADLVRKLCDAHGKLFILKVSEYDYTFYIEYKLRKICSITRLVIYKKYSIDKLIEPKIISYKENKQLKLIPPLIEIINLYDSLYDPKYFLEWEKILENINKLESLALENIEINVKTNNDKLAVSPSFIITKLPTKQKQKAKIVKLETLLEFVSNTDYLIISKIDALDIKNNLEVLEIMSKNDIEFDIVSLQKFLNKYGIAITYKEHKLYIPNEYAMTKYNIYMQYNNGKDIVKQRIMSIYNNITYQLVNYEQTVIDGKLYKMVDPVTVIKFIYISIWSNILYHRVSVYSDKVFYEFINKKLTLLKHYKSIMSINHKDKHNYVGTYINPLVNKKILNIQNLNKGKTNYYCYEMDTFAK